MYWYKTFFATCIAAFTLMGCSSKPTHDQPSANEPATAAPVINYAPSDEDLAKIYAQSIADYIKAVNVTYGFKFDTLYIGKRKFGQPDDFPDIQLPENIENTPVRLISPETGAQIQQVQPSSFYINQIGWVNAEGADFRLIAFSEGFKHQFDCSIQYQLDAGTRAFKMTNLRFENFLYKKQ